MKKIRFLLLLLLTIPFGMLINPAYSSTTNNVSTNNFVSSTYYNSITPTTFKGNFNITTFVGPDNAYQVIMGALKNSHTSFYLEVYTLSSEPLVNELIRAHDRGVSVIVLLSHDRVSSYEDEYTEEAAYRLDSAGIDVLWTSSDFRFTHAKFWIVDHKLAFVYSGNWAPSSIPQYPSARKNREMGFCFDNSDIASYYENVLLNDMSESTPYDSSIGHTGNLQANATTGTYEHPFSPSTFVEYAEVTPIFSPDDSYSLLSKLIQSANETIDLELQYILFDCPLLNDIINAAKRGVTIRVIINEPDSSTDNVTSTLLASGIQVKFFKGLGHNHNKYVCVDGHVVQISSINWSDNSLNNNREAGAIVDNAHIATYFTVVFQYDWDKSETPSGFTTPLSILSPKEGSIADASYEFSINFAVYSYTSATLLIDDKSAYTWDSPAGIKTVTLDLSSYSQGIHTVKVTAQPSSGDNVTQENKFNIIHSSKWLCLISEVRYDAESEPKGEFVELYNAFDFKVYIGGWIISDNEDNYIIPSGATMSAGQVLIFAHDANTFITEMGHLGITGVTADYSLGDLSLANSGDEVILLDPDKSLLDGVAWGSGHIDGVVSWSGSTGEDKSLQRVPANSDTNDCTVDFTADTPTPGKVTINSASTSSNPSSSDNLSFTGSSIIILLSTILGITSLASLSMLVSKKKIN